MRGIDVSRWNSWPFNSVTEKAYKESDFVIVKATQGESGYSYESYFKKAIDRVLKDGKLGGAYHYAAGRDPEKEAEYFVSVIKPYLGKIVPALDWESGSNKSWRSKTWCKLFCDRFHKLTGIYPLLYTGVTGCKDNEALAGKCPLWFAGYPTNAASWTVPNFPGRYNLGKFKKYTIWQFTSGGHVDRNTTALTKAEWMKLAGAKTQASAPAAKKSVTEIAKEVIAGKWGNGEDRKKKLKAAGYDYDKVQAKVNELSGKKSAAEIAKEVIAGKWGNGAERKRKLTQAGYNPAEIQKIVNKLSK